MIWSWKSSPSAFPPSSVAASPHTWTARGRWGGSTSSTTSAATPVRRTSRNSSRPGDPTPPDVDRAGLGVVAESDGDHAGVAVLADGGDPS